jgi:hypothetical protein
MRGGGAPAGGVSEDRTETQGRSGREALPVDFALQGGRVHGALRRGVLDRMLEEPWLRIGDIPGTSADAMDAAVLASGYARGAAAPGGIRRTNMSEAPGQADQRPAEPDIDDAAAVSIVNGDMPIPTEANRSADSR